MYSLIGYMSWHIKDFEKDKFSRSECHNPVVVSELNYKLAAYFKLLVFDLGPSSQYILCNS